MKTGLQSIAIAVLLATGQMASAIDLNQAYTSALTYDAVYLGATATLRAGQEKAEQGQALLRPQVTANANATYRNDIAHVSGSGRNSASGETYGYSVTVSQPIYNALASATRGQLIEQARLADVAFGEARQGLILRTAQAYFDVLFAEDNLRLARVQLQATRRTLDQAQKSFEVGVATATDVSEAHAAFDAVTALEISLVNDVEVKRNAFTKLTGLASTASLATLMEGATAMAPEPDDLEHWLAKAEAGSRIIALQRGSLEIAAAEIEKFRAEKQVSVAVVGGYGSNWNRSGLVAANGGLVHANGASIGVQVNVPLYTGGSTSSKLREALALRDEAQLRLEATRRDVEQATRTGFLSVRTTAAQVRAMKQALFSAQTLLEATKVGLEVGVRTTLDVLNAEQKVYSTQRDFAQIRYAHVMSQLSLYASVGELGEDQVRSINSMLNQP